MYLGMQQCSTGLLQMLRSGAGKGLPTTTEGKRVPTINIAIMVMLNRCADLGEAMTENFGPTSVVRLKIDDRPTLVNVGERAATMLLIVCMCAGHMMTP